VRAAYELHCAAVVLLALVDQPLHGEVDVGLVADGVYGGHLVRVRVRVRVRIRVRVRVRVRVRERVSS